MNEKIVVEEEKNEEENKNATKKRINEMYSKKLCPSVEHLVEFLYVLYWLVLIQVVVIVFMPRLVTYD